MTASMQQQYLAVMNDRHKGLGKLLLVSTALIGTLTLSACQTAPSAPNSTGAGATTTTINTPQGSVTNRNDASNTADYSSEPYIAPAETTRTPANPPYSEPQTRPRSESSSTTTNNPLTQQTPIIEQPEIIFNEPVYTPPRDDYMISQPPATPSHNELLEQARQNSQQQSRKSTSNQSNLPAFRNLMQTGTNQLKSGNLTAAENSFTRAQRLAPRSSAVYFYLSQVALKKGQPRKAEAMARRGLTVSEDDSRRRALWQLILRSGQQQNNSRVVREAQLALK
ncbi:tetratricopeptide repeat protein [Psychrobacter sp. P2G3]|uniref:tetratricopeptide repeat protein n=1 Tax=Psychrobacter sp. P2G3 TaxID=1699622 RepID=UPI00082EE30A|nr:tetratricopeptide repeat protein [Psychrobacter sp. P2G3]